MGPRNCDWDRPEYIIMNLSDLGKSDSGGILARSSTNVETIPSITIAGIPEA